MGSIGSGPSQDSLLWAMGSLVRAEQEHDKDGIRFEKDPSGC